MIPLAIIGSVFIGIMLLKKAEGNAPMMPDMQNANPVQLISAGDLNLSDLGSMMGGKDGNNMDFQRQMGDGQFGGIQSNDGQRVPPGNNGPMRQHK